MYIYFLGHQKSSSHKERSNPSFACDHAGFGDGGRGTARAANSGSVLTFSASAPIDRVERSTKHWLDAVPVSMPTAQSPSAVVESTVARKVSRLEAAMAVEVVVVVVAQAAIRGTCRPRRRPCRCLPPSSSTGPTSRISCRTGHAKPTRRLFSRSTT